MTPVIDDMMERASQALVQREYLEAEAVAQRALVAARAARDWDSYTRIILPLQEARRQRRMTAAEGVIRLGSTDLEGGPKDWLDRCPTGCLLLSTPCRLEDAAQVWAMARERRLYVEVLFCGSRVDQEQWTLRAVDGPAVTAAVEAPPAEWRDRWIDAGDAGGRTAATPADWVLDALEALGDAALRLVEAPLGDVARVEQIEAMLEAVPDHEFLHQRLADAARALRSG